MADAKRAPSASGGAKSAAEGDLAATSKDSSSDVQAKSDAHDMCMTRSDDFDAETKSRGEELNVPANAKKALHEMTGNAVSVGYSLVQMSRFAFASWLAERTRQRWRSWRSAWPQSQSQTSLAKSKR